MLFPKSLAPLRLKSTQFRPRQRARRHQTTQKHRPVRLLGNQDKRRSHRAQKQYASLKLNEQQVDKVCLLFCSCVALNDHFSYSGRPCCAIGDQSAPGSSGVLGVRLKVLPVCTGAIMYLLYYTHELFIMLQAPSSPLAPARDQAPMSPRSVCVWFLFILQL